MWSGLIKTSEQRASALDLTVAAVPQHLEPTTHAIGGDDAGNYGDVERRIVGQGSITRIAIEFSPRPRIAAASSGCQPRRLGGCTAHWAVHQIRRQWPSANFVSGDFAEVVAPGTGQTDGADDV
jgi:hypothetical protein